MEDLGVVNMCFTSLKMEHKNMPQTTQVYVVPEMRVKALKCTAAAVYDTHPKNVKLFVPRRSGLYQLEDDEFVIEHVTPASVIMAVHTGHKTTYCLNCFVETTIRTFSVVAFNGTTASAIMDGVRDKVDVPGTDIVLFREATGNVLQPDHVLTGSIISGIKFGVAFMPAATEAVIKASVEDAVPATT